MTSQIQRQLVSIIADTFAFVRSAEVNQAIQFVSLDQLIYDQIRRNGESKDSNSSQYNPYSYDPEAPTPAGVQPIATANYLGGSDTNLPTKIARIMALKNVLAGTIEQIKKIEPQTLQDLQDLERSAAEDTLTTNDEQLFNGAGSVEFNQ